MADKNTNIDSPKLHGIEDIKLPDDFDPEVYRVNASKFFNSGGPMVKRQGKILKDPDVLITGIELSYNAPSLNQAVDQAADCTCKVQYCSNTDSGCGLDRPIREMNISLAQGNWVDAYFLFGTQSPFMEGLGLACAHACEYACVHAGNDHTQGVQISFNEYTLGYAGRENGLLPYLFHAPEEKNEYNVGIVGSGPAGLQAAYRAAFDGYSDVHVYEKNGPKITSDEALNDPEKMKELVSYLGGQFRNIPNWKFEDTKLDEILELMIRKQNIHFHTGIEVGGPDYPADKFKNDFDVTILAPGVGAQPTKLSIKGEEYVTAALDYRDSQYRSSIGHTPGEEYDFSKNPMYMGDKKIVVISGGLTGEDCEETAIKEIEYEKRKGGKPGELIALIRNLEPGHEASIDIRHPVEPDSKSKSTSAILTEKAGSKKEYQQYIKEIIKQENGQLSIIVGHRDLHEEWQAKVSKGNRKWKNSEKPDYIIENVDAVISAAGFERLSTKPTKLAYDFGIVDKNGLIKINQGKTEQPGLFVAGDASTSVIASERWYLHTALGDGNKVMEQAAEYLSDKKRVGIGAIVQTLAIKAGLSK